LKAIGVDPVLYVTKSEFEVDFLVFLKMLVRWQN
jgi:hypothetical protein